jgi:exopolyphosphatase / guanosine-5'-triphosphate,3'-diphosphate pyrophosphatase
MIDGTYLAAVDIGSNSFRLEIGQWFHGHIQRVDYLKETVRLGAGLNENRELNAQAIADSLRCLSRFSERLAHFDSQHVRAVATQTVREARNQNEFVARASDCLGFPIEVISGREEARLIYEGISHLLPKSDERRLAIDIGGRSTELILGRGINAELMASYQMGSVSWSDRYFSAGDVSARRFSDSIIAAQSLLEDIVDSLNEKGWDVAHGSSGTVGAVAEILRANGVGGANGGITAEGLAWLKQQLIVARSTQSVDLPGLKDDRKPVIAGGLSILLALFELLKIDELRPAEGALRHGLLYELVGRSDHRPDIRALTVQRLAEQFQIDKVQARHVTDVASSIYQDIADSQHKTERHARKLAWACHLHEIGRLVSHSGYHKHGSYIIANADALGFTQPELHRLGQLVLGQRGKLRKLQADLEDPAFALQLLALRLAVVICHARRQPQTQGLNIRKRGSTVVITANTDWSERYPQSMYLLEQEVLSWRGAASELKLQWDSAG